MVKRNGHEPRECPRFFHNNEVDNLAESNKAYSTLLEKLNYLDIGNIVKLSQQKATYQSEWLPNNDACSLGKTIKAKYFYR